ncbi:hypothetical protein BOX15_Mlig000210g3 [Macrostomum lignano]|uniref:Ion transport domain-containing protein n=1 Tax=Macrostomum lignano TaxID=282301 RepID=A0A267H4S2_9PLAT|nr:hypothetical protein BOX15_Mlig000210g3 [Macrostomum lignano]
MSQSYSSRHSDNRVGPTADKMSPSVVESQLQELQQRSAGQEALTLEQCRSLKPDDMARRFFHSVREGNSDQVSRLLKCNSSLVSKLDEQLMSGLHYAVKCNRVDMVSLLMQAGANVNIKGREGSRPIHVAANFNQSDALRELLNSRRTRVDATDDRGQTALHVACRRNHEPSVKILLSHKANSQLKELDGTSVLHLPSRRNNLELCQMLTTDTGLITCKDKYGVTPLMVAAAEGSEDLLNYFISVCKKTTHGAAGRILDMQDSEGNSSVHFAAKNDKFLAIEILSEHGANLDLQNLEQSAPIHLAATLGHRESVAKLIHLGALPNLSDKNGRTPLHCCIIARQLEICDTLLLAGAQSRAADEDFMTPLHWACRRGLTQAARRLLRVDPGCLSLVDIHMRTGLHWAVLACAVDLVELLLAQAGDSDESANASDFHDKYPVHYAVEMNDSQLVRILLTHGADFHAVDTEGRTATQLAVKLGHEGLVRDICGLGQYIKRQALRHRDLRGVTSLLIAAEHGHTRVLHFLLEQGADFTAKDEFGRTALMLSCGGGHSDIVATMIDKGVDVNASDVNRNTALHYACKHAGSSARSLELLLSNGAQLQQNYNGETPVDVAVLNNNGPAISLLFSDAYCDWVMSYRKDTGMSHMDILIQHSPQTALTILNRSMTKSGADNLEKNFMVTHNFFYLDPGPDDPASKPNRYLGLRTMVERQREDLLKHPLCAALLEYKWSFTRYFFWCDFFFYAVFLCCLTAFVADQGPLPISLVDANTGCRNTSSSGGSGQRQKLTNGRLILEKSVVIGFLCVRLVLEFIKLVFKRLQYLKNYENLFFVTLYILTFVFIYPPDSEPCIDNWIFGIFSVILAWCLLIFQFEHLPVTGIYSLMFQKVIISLVKVLLIFAFFIIGFGLAFNIGLVSQTPFKYPMYSILKTFDMTVGEMEFVTYFISGTSGRMQLALLVVFVIFVVVMPIGLMNLLVGIAVGDIEGISKEAGLRLVEIRINLVYEMETNLPRYFQRRLYRRFLQFYPNRTGNRLVEYMRPYGMQYRDWLQRCADDRAETTNEERLEAVEAAVQGLTILLKDIRQAVVH